MFMRLSSGFTFGDNCTSSDTSYSYSSVGLPRGVVVGFKDVTSRLGADALTQLSVLMKLL